MKKLNTPAEVKLLNRNIFLRFKSTMITFGFQLNLHQISSTLLIQSDYMANTCSNIPFDDNDLFGKSSFDKVKLPYY